MVKIRSNEASRIGVRFLEDPDESPGEEVGINISQSCTDLHELSSRRDIRLHHTMPGRLRPQLSCEGQLMSDRAHLIGRACWSGGWQNTILNRRREGITPANEEDEIQEISQAMRTDTKLMADTVDGEVMRRNTFREMTKSLKLRRELKQRLTLSQPTDQIVFPMKNVHDYFSSGWLQFRRIMAQFLHDNSLWHGSIVQVEGIFGRNVGAFFHFLRDLVVLNFLMALIVCGFLLVPQLLQHSRAESVASESLSFGALDWLTGAGWFDTTALYYGGYSTGNNSSSIASTSQYNMTYAYFFVITSCLLAFLFILLVRVCNLYKQHYIHIRDDVNCNFTRMLFTGWDFRISDSNAAKIKRSSLYNELMESIQELMEEEEIDSFYRYLRRKAIQVFTWLILTSFVGLLSWAIHVFLTKEYDNLIRQDISYAKESINFLVFPLIVTAIMYGVPLIFDAVGRKERYMKKQTALYVSLIRFTMLELLILAVLFMFWYGNSPGLIDEMPVLQFNAQKRVDAAYYQDGNVSNKCWESALGQEIYRLVLIDFIFLAVNVLCVNIIRNALVKKGKLKESILEFNISANILHIIYNQTLLWAGVFFCPLLPVIMTVKFVCIFYLYKFDLTRNLRPNTRPWRASQSETLFNSLALFSLILAIFGYGFIVVCGYSSDNCGPFQVYAHYIDCLWSFSVDSERVILQIVKWLFKPLSIAVILGFLCILVVCAKNIAEGRIEMVCLLQHQVQLEIEDKKYYMALMDQVQRGNYKPGSPIRDLPPDVSTMRDRDLDSSNLSKRASFTFSRGNHAEESPL